MNFTPNEVLGKNGLIEPDKNVDEQLDKSPSGLRLKPKIDMETSAPDDKLGTNMDAELGINENECSKQLEGINHSSSVTTSIPRDTLGINTSVEMGRNSTACNTGSKKPEPTNSPLRPRRAESATSVSSSIARSNMRSTGDHKHRPKLKGKHLRPHVKGPNTEDSSLVRKLTPKKINSEFVMVTHGLRKPKKTRHFKCPVCNMVTDSQALVSKHYRKNHPPVKCTICDQMFNNPCSLRRHRYTHKDLKYPCRSCNKSFPFKSNLVNHHLKHRRHPGYQCNHQEKGAICGKWYFAKSDLTKHLKTHSGKVYSCLECNYTTYDIRYLRAHRYTHSDKERYMCQKCEKRYKHHTQLIRHKAICLQSFTSCEQTVNSKFLNILGINQYCTIYTFL